jgi:hypothetical protein
MPSMHSVAMVALLPIAINNHDIPQKWLDEERRSNQVVRNRVLWQVLHPPTFKQNPIAKSRYFNVLCADGNFRHCKPVLASSLADSPEYSYQHHF